MSQPIYKHFRGGFKEAMHQLTQEEQASLMAKVAEALEKVGGERIIMCNAGWSSDQYGVFGVEKFPDLAAVQKFRELLDELNWYRYVESESLLGTEWQPPS